MRSLPSTEEMRKADSEAVKDLGGDEFLLMERASLALSKAMAGALIPSLVLVICGPGNNGGDGLCLARFLLDRGVKVKVLRIPSEKYSESNKKAFSLLRAELFVDNIIDADLYIDAIFGTGQKLPISDHIKRFIPRGGRVWSVDVPTGVNADTGETDDEYLPPEKTFAVQAIKRGMTQCDCGEIHIVEAGMKLGKTQFESLEEAPPKPIRPRFGHKYDSGPVGIVSGDMKGAFHFAVEGAKASGTSLVVGLGDFDAPDEVVMVKDRDDFLGKKLKSIVVGPGLGAFEFDLTGIETPLVIDADALKRMGGRKFRSNAVLTPHRGEAKALLNHEIKDPFKSALEIATRHEAVVLLKGPGSILVSPEGVGYVFSRPNPNLSIGGSGDVLAGYIGGLIAAGLSPFDALKRAVLDQGSVPTRPSFVSAFEIANHLRSVLT